MRKLTLLITMLFLSLGMAWAQTNQNGSLVTFTNVQVDGTEYVLYITDGGVLDLSKKSAADLGEAAQFRATKQSNGKWTFYNESKGLYMIWRGNKSGGYNSNAGTLGEYNATYCDWAVKTGSVDGLFRIVSMRENGTTAGSIVIMGSGRFDAYGDDNGYVSGNNAHSNQFRIDVVDHFGFEPAKDYASIKKWYYLTLRPEANWNRRLYYGGNDGLIDASKTTVDVKDRDAYSWAFVGNPFDGYKVVNKKAGEGKYLNTTDAGGGVGTAEHVFTLTASTAIAGVSNGFFMAANGKHPFNLQSNTLKYWHDPDAGSTFAVALRDFDADLKVSIDNANLLLTDYTSTVGWVTAESKSAIETAISKAETAISNKSGYDEADDAIWNAIANVKTIQPETDKYYMIVSMHNDYAAGGKIAVGTSDNGLIWNSEENVSKWFKFADAGEGKFYLYNVKTGRYLSTANASANNQQFAHATTIADAKKVTITNMGKENIVKIVPDGGAMIHAQRATGYIVCWDNPDYTSASAWTIVEVENPGVAYIDNTNYATLQEAVNAVQAGQTINLIANTDETIVLPKGMKLDVIKFNGFTADNVSEAPTVAEVATLAGLQAALAAENELPIIITETIVIPADKTVTIDLNGKTVTHQDEATKYAINNLGTLIIQDTKGNGSINARGIYNGYGNGGANVATAKITVLSGTINAKGTDGGAAIFNYGVADIQGGNFTSIGGYSLNNQSGASMTIAAGVTANNGIYANGATLVVNGGEINGNRSGCHVLYAWNSNVTIAGGTFHNNNSGNSTTMAGGTTKLTIDGGTFSIASGKSTTGWTSCLIDATGGGKYEINGGEFQGHFRVQANCAMEINGGTFENTHGEAYVNGGTVAVNGGTFTDAAAQKFATDNLAAGYELGTDGTVVAKPVAEVNGAKYTTFAAAAGAVQAGGEIKLLANIDGDIEVPAGVTLNGNGFAVNGVVTALGEITFAGVTKAKNFGVENVNTVVNIPAGASLQLGTDRMVIGHGCTFNITGTIEDAKTADKATLVPSLVMPGASFTGAGVTFNVTNAYISAPSSYCSSSKSASGTFDFNINNSIWENAGKLAFESQSTAATVNFDLVNSVLNTGSHLLFSVSRGEVVIDNSNVNVGKSNQIENLSTMTIKNGSVVNGAVATSSNAKNPGTIIVENATYAVTGEFSGSDLGIGTLIIKKGATVSAGSITKANITIDATDMAAGDVVNLTANLANLEGELSVINNDKLEAKIVDGEIVLVAKPVAKIGEQGYATLDEAFKAATSGCTIEILSDVTVDSKWDCRYTGSKFTVPVTINGNGKTIKFTASVNDNNWNTVFRFEENATVNNLTVDISNATGAQRVISAKKSLNVDGLNIVGAARYGVIYGEGASATDLAATEIVVKNSTLGATRRAVSDNEGGKDVKSVVIEGNTFNANVYVSASKSIAFNNNTVNGETDLRSYAADNVLNVQAQDNTLATDKKNYIYAKTIVAQDGFETKNPPLKVATKAELNAALAAAKEGDVITLTADIDYGTDQLAITKAVTLDLGGKTLTTRNAWGGMSIKGNPTVKNGTIVHASNTAAIKVWNATAFEDLVIDVQGKGDANKTIGGIVLQSGSTTKVGSIKNVTIKGAALTNGIETYNCGDATENVIGAMENVTIDAQGTGMLISAPCGTATNCDIKGGANAVEIFIKGNYSASLDLVNSKVEGGVYAHDEFSSNPDVVNNGTLKFTADEQTTGAKAEDVTLTLVRAEENVQGVLKEIVDNAKAKVNDTYHATLTGAIAAAKAGDVVTVFEGTYAMPSVKAGITIVGEGNVMFEGTLSGTLENLTMKNIHIKGGNAQRWAYAKGDLVFENVTFEATSVYALHFDGIAAGTNLTYKNCTIIGWAAMGGTPESCVFEGCTIKGNGSYGVIRTYFDATINNCTFDVANVNTNDVYQDGIHAVEGAKVTVTNCTNANGDMTDLVNVHGASVVTVDGVEYKNVAKVGDNYYATFAEAYTAAQAGETVTMLADLNMSEILVLDKAITLDGNGKTLTSTAGRAINVSGADGVTIKNLTINASGERAINVIKNATNVTIENVTATAANYTVNVASSAPNAVVAINNSTLNGLCTVNVSAAGAKVTVDNCTVNCNDNNTTTGESYAALSLNKEAVGGSIVATNSTINVTDGSDSMKGRNGAENGTVTINESTDGVAVMVAAITYPNSDAYHAFATLKAAVEFAKAGDVVTLIRDVTMDYNARDAYATQAQNVVINGNGKKLTLNQKNSDWASFGLANNSKLVLNNMTIEKTGYGDTSGAWNTHAIIFSCPVEMNNVTVNNSVAVQAGATLNNVTINEAGEYYGLWINGNGQTVTLNGGAINATNAGRGIKIADQYIDAPAQVTLNVTDTKFTTKKKAAVLVSSKAGAKIAASNVNIEDVAADKVNFVWVDEDWAAHFANVQVEGATVAQEGIENFVAQLSNGASYKTLAEAIKAVQAGDNTIKLLADCAEKVTITQVPGTNIVINGNGKTYTGTITVKGDKVANNIYNTETLTFQNINFAPAYNTYAITAEKNTYARNITIDGCTFKGNNDVYGIRVRNGYNYTVKNTTAEGVYTFFNASEALVGLTVENVSVKCANVAFSGAYGYGNASFKNVTVESDNNGVKVNNPNGSALTFENCSITAKTPVTFIENAGVTSALTAEFNGTNTMTVNNGGTHWFNIVEAGATDATFKAIVNDAALDMSNTAFVASVGNVYYSNLQKAINEATDGATIVVARDIALDAANCVTNSDGYSVFVNVAGKAVTIDLNGKAVTANLSAEQFATAKSSLLMAVLSVDTNGNLTLTDNSTEGTGKVAVTANDASVYSLISNYDKSAKLTINGGSYELDKARAKSSLIHSDPSEAVVVNGGNFYLGNVNTGENGSPWIFNVNGNNTGHVIVNGGTFNYDINHQYWAFEVHVDKTSALKDNGKGTWTVVPAIAYVTEANNGYTREAGYATLEDAINSKYGNEITLLANATGAGVVINKDVTIYFNGNTYTVNKAVGSKGTETLGFQILKDNEVTLKKGTLTSTAVVEGKEVMMLIQNYANLTLEDMNLVDATGHILYALSNNSGDVKLLGNTNITTDAVAFDACKYGSYDAPTVNVNTTGKITGAIEKNDGATIAISGGIFTTEILPEWCATDYAPFDYEDGTFGVEYTVVDELTLVDGEVTEFVNQNDKTVGTLIYKRTLASDLYNALYVPFEIPVADFSEKYEFYYFNDVHSDVNGVPTSFEIVKITEGTLKANHPYLVKPINAEDKNMVLEITGAQLRSTTKKQYVVDCSSAYTLFTVRGTYSVLNGADYPGCYGMSVDGDLALIGSGKLGAFRIYLQITDRDTEKPVILPNVNNIRLRVIGEGSGDTTDIKYYDVENQNVELIFDLQGRRVLEPKKGGIYIINGKKVYYNK